MATEAEFRATWSMAAGRSAAAQRWADSLVTRHREPWRHYHTLDHVVWVLRHVRTIARHAPCRDDDAVVVAACFHDAIYDPRSNAGVNEHDSAELAAEALRDLGWDEHRIAVVAGMIEATATHEATGDRDRDILIAADLAILASGPAAYSDYVRQVRSEYDFVNDVDWGAGRCALLNAWLDRPHLFPATLAALVPELDDWDRRARANISAEAAALLSGDE